MSKPKSRMVKTRILIISDTHAALPEQQDVSVIHRGGANGNDDHDHDAATTPYQTPFHPPLPSADVLIHAGDLTMTGSLMEHERALELLQAVDAPLKIVIPGNHDLTLDRPYYARHHDLHTRYARYGDATLDEIQDMYSGPEARAAGVRYLVEGLESFRLQNGARLNVYASAWQPEFFDWAFGYPRNRDRFNRSAADGDGTSKNNPANPVPDFVRAHTEDGKGECEDGDESENVHVMLTHGPPMGILDKVARTRESVGCEHLRRAVERCRPKIHCFGHIHEAWGAVRKAWDLGGTQNAGTSTGRSVGDDVDDDDDDDNNEKGTRASAATSSGGNPDQPPGQFDPIRNPTTVYTYGDYGTTGHEHPGETLIQPGSYQDQIGRMAAYVDATDLEHGKETVFVNASIMNLRYRAVNAPWLVDVELPVVE
ncbi:hypothetical protein H2204_008703 [Knufia peltigerae]|uniref:Calcineurin-like phosphoesterase domain-containing protein n=1 Tax=Knufia peltigerae TaxID=1002370 RepID=A0AA39CVR7_9EURO|nr:hypothetical protein H2204_008703 [Knufia peltigerae]